MDLNKTYLPVNWVNGMNINQSHFITEQKSNLAFQMQGFRNQITPYNYGMSLINIAENNYIWIDVNNNLEIEVELKNLSLLFPNGYVLNIDVPDNEIGKYACNISQLQENNEAWIIISVNAFKRVSYGEPDVDESPVRKPFIIPEVKISVVDAYEKFDASFWNHHLIIAKLIKQNESWSVDRKYIPPVQKTIGNPVLNNQHLINENYLSSIERSTIEIIQKIRAKKQDNDLSKILIEMSMNLNQYLSQTITKLKQVNAYEPPLYQIVYFIEMARIINNTLETWQGCGRDEMLTYLADWCDISQGEFETMIQSVITHKYDHNNIRKSIDVITSFADTVSSMFAVLASLDYIGKKIETNLFVAEEQDDIVEEGTTKRKRKFSLLGN